MEIFIKLLTRFRQWRCKHPIKTEIERSEKDGCWYKKEYCVICQKEIYSNL